MGLCAAQGWPRKQAVLTEELCLGLKEKNPPNQRFYLGLEQFHMTGKDIAA